MNFKEVWRKKFQGACLLWEATLRQLIVLLMRIWPEILCPDGSRRVFWYSSTRRPSSGIVRYRNLLKSVQWQWYHGYEELDRVDRGVKVQTSDIRCTDWRRDEYFLWQRGGDPELFQPNINVEEEASFDCLPQELWSGCSRDCPYYQVRHGHRIEWLVYQESWQTQTRRTAWCMDILSGCVWPPVIGSERGGFIPKKWFQHHGFLCNSFYSNLALFQNGTWIGIDLKGPR